VVDEVHERSLQGDVLMALLQRIAAARNKAADEAAAAAAAAGGRQQQQHGQPQRLKVILMSATLDANIYRWVIQMRIKNRSARTAHTQRFDCWAVRAFELATVGRVQLQLVCVLITGYAFWTLRPYSGQCCHTFRRYVITTVGD
jgi:hypothetical protein